MESDRLFDSIQPRTLRTAVVDKLRAAIVSGRLQPGEHLAESAIADQMSVSRSPIREALRQLEQEGLVVSVPNQGCSVIKLEPEDVRELFLIRAAIEGLACQVVIEDGLLEPRDFARLEQLISLQREAVEAVDFQHLTDLDMAFHDFLCRKAGLPRLYRMWRSIRAQMQVLFYQRFRAMPEYVPKTVDTDHSAILVVLRARQVERVLHVHREINARVAEECVAILRWAGAGGTEAASDSRRGQERAESGSVTVVS